MKYILILSILSLSLFSKDNGSALYNSCKFCHGIDGSNRYEGFVPSIKDMEVDTLEIKLKLYKKGSINKYGYGPIMKQQMSNIPDDKISILAKYIKSL